MNHFDRPKKLCKILSKFIFNVLKTNKFKKTQIAIYWDYLYNNSNEVFTFKQFSPSCLEFYRKDNNMTLNISSLIKEKIEFIQQNLISKD